jgi:DNA mismatch endonuclease (patch repair protein)
MRRIRSKGMKPEMAVRRLVHRMGYRYRLHAPDLPGKPDLVFRSRRKIIFVHGCFWHGHPSKSCPIVRTPKSNTSYWNPKLALNTARDQRNQQRLRRAGWSVMVVWECHLRKPDRLMKRIAAFLEG